MVGLRVQDIDLVVDLRATLPWVPPPPPDEELAGQQGDGTVPGVGSGSERDKTEYVLERSQQYGVCEWALVCFWPELVIRFFDLVNTTFTTILEFSIDLLGNIRTILVDTFVDWLESLIATFSTPDILFGIASSILTGEAWSPLPVWEMAYFAWFTFDTLRASGAGLVACVGAALVAAGLSIGFFAMVETWVTNWLSVGVSYEEILKYYAGVFVAFVVHLLCPLKYWPETFIKLGYKLALVTTDMTKIGMWNPVLGIGRIAFVVATFLYLLYRIDYYEDLR